MKRTSKPLGLLIIISACMCLHSGSGYALTIDPLQLQQQATKRIDQFIDHFKKTGDRSTLLPQLKQAEFELMASVQEFDRTGNLSGASLSLVKLADSQRLQSRWNQAVDLYEKAAARARKANHAEYQARALKGMAKAEFLGLNSLSEAISHLEQALALTAHFDDKGFLFDVLDETAQIQIRKGEVTAAADTLSRAFAVIEPLNDRTRLYYGYLDRAEVYQKIAEKCDFERTFKLCLGSLDLSKNDYEQALALAKGLGYEGLAKQTEDFLRMLENRRMLIRSRERMEHQMHQTRAFKPVKPDDVLVHEQFTGASATLPPEIVAVIQQRGGFARAGDARSQYLQGLFLAMQGEHDSAFQAYLKAAELLEHDRQKLRDEQGRGGYFEDKIEFYYAPILGLLDRRRLPEAFDLLERSRARGMLDMLANKSLALPDAQDNALFGEAMSLNARIGVLQKGLIEDRSRPDREKYRDRIDKAEKQIQALETEYRAVLQRMDARAPKVKQLLVSERPSLQQIKDLSKREGFDVLEYLCLETNIILWHIHGEAVHVKSVFLPRSELIRKVSSLRENVADKGKSQESFDNKTANELFLFLIQPLLKEIRTRRLVIIPHEDLNYIPFQVLQNPADKQFLGEQYQISYAPSATILARLPRTSHLKGKKLLAVADPRIEENTKEVDTIRTLYRDNKAVTDTLPRETQVKEWASEYNLLHFSVHGRFNETEPMLSSLELQKDEQNDGHLTAAEMFGLTLDNADLVVLSACDTGQVEATHANEVLGMLSALMYSGAKALMLSSWQVDSQATARWMEEFYRSVQNVPPTEAARRAIIAVKSNPKYQHPYYWAPFLVVAR